MTTEARLLGEFVSGKSFLQISPETLVRDVAVQMPANHSSAAVVIDENDKLIGILTEQDIVERAVGIRRNVDETTAKEIMTADPVFVLTDAPLSKALQVMTENGFRTLPVVDGDRVIGIIDIRDLYEALSRLLKEEISLKDGLISYAYSDNYGSGYRKAE